jgi:hypothetical protein
MFELIQINQQRKMVLIYDAEDLDGMIILRWIFRKLDGVVGTGWSWLSSYADTQHCTLYHL